MYICSVCECLCVCASVPVCVRVCELGFYITQGIERFGQFARFALHLTNVNVASQEGNNSSAAAGSSSGVGASGGASGGPESAALFSKLRSFSIGSGPNSPQRVVSNLRGFLTHRLSNITPSDTGKFSPAFPFLYIFFFHFPMSSAYIT